ncbi:MAG: gamma-butyrobetaine hydroxylase-like domain-containing protein, partial [Lysobacterales bacterium]
MSAPTPTNITLHRASHVLEIAFDSGETFHLPAEYLRTHSPSAEVQGHGHGQRELVWGR